MWPFSTRRERGPSSERIDLELWYRERYLGPGSLWARRHDASPGLRLTFEPSFRGLPQSVELTWERAGARIVSESPYASFRRWEGWLERRAAFELEVELREARLWEEPSTDRRTGLDGETWILECLEGERYHVLFRWSPLAGPLRALLRSILRIGGQDLDRVEAEEAAAREDPSVQARKPGSGRVGPCPWGGCRELCAAGDDVCSGHRRRLNALVPRRSTRR